MSRISSGNGRSLVSLGERREGRRREGTEAYDINRDSLNIPASSNFFHQRTMLHDRTRCNINFRATVHANRAWNFSLKEIINGEPAASRTWTFIKFYLG